MGLLNLSKMINNYKKGFYIHYKFEGNSQTLNEISKKIKMDNLIIRNLVVKYKQLDLKVSILKNKRNNNTLKKRTDNSLSRLSLFQKSDTMFSKKCPLSLKNSPKIDYKNISLLKKYISDNRKIISSKISSVSLNKQRILTREIKRAKILGLI